MPQQTAVQTKTACAASRTPQPNGRGRLKTQTAFQTHQTRFSDGLFRLPCRIRVGCVAKATHAFPAAANSRTNQKPRARRAAHPSLTAEAV
ncbi:hypothetical protein [Kingella potus]|uniref:hypothetical protein n=1 Tax=Kingella potus TaxID=265175 RepID=UPI001FD28D40|nr:hypothetical protein [Kingella potus]UOP01566.1 hypothetical protein LVJ84_05115 [Kingella potus]